MLKISHFSKSYDSRHKAVDDLSLEVCSGDIFAFIGHNGAGKTTTLKAVVGILPFEEGTIKIDDLDINEYPLEVKKRLAYIPDLSLIHILPSVLVTPNNHSKQSAKNSSTAFQAPPLSPLVAKI